MSTHHDLKIWPTPLAAVRAGTKTFEIRENDRDFREGDTVTLHEFAPSYTVADSPYPPGYTGEKEGPFTIGTVVPGGQWGLPENLCVFSLIRPSPAVQEPVAWAVPNSDQLSPMYPADKARMIAAGGEQKRVAEKFTIPLYAHPTVSGESPWKGVDSSPKNRWVLGAFDGELGQFSAYLVVKRVGSTWFCEGDDGGLREVAPPFEWMEIPGNLPRPIPETKEVK